LIHNNLRGGAGQTPLRIDYTYNANGQVTHLTHYGKFAGSLTDTSGNFEEQITNLLRSPPADETILASVFARHVPPLVPKTDNCSAFLPTRPRNNYLRRRKFVVLAAVYAKV